MKSPEKCLCGKDATWLYMPSSGNRHPYYCEDCVPRGCDCNIEHTLKYFKERVIDPYDGEEMIYCDPPSDRTDWVWIEEGYSWENVDEKGRRLPCCEFWEV